MTMPNSFKRALARVFGVKLTTPDDERDEFWARVIFDHAHGVLLSAARPYEPDWTDETRFTTLGYLIRLAEHYQSAGPVDRQEAIARLAYQKFCVKLVSQDQFNHRLTRLEASNNKYFESGRKAAAYDLAAMNKGTPVHGFFDALQFPSDSYTVSKR